MSNKVVCTAVFITASIVGCATPSTPAPTSRDKTSQSALAKELVDEAEGVHHCAGEDPTDDPERRTFLRNCMRDGTKRVRELLPLVHEQDLAPGVYNIIRLYLNPETEIPDEEIRRLCATLPPGDSMPDALIDDEVRETICQTQ